MDPVVVDEMLQAAQARASALERRHAPGPLPRLYDDDAAEDDDAATTQQKNAAEHHTQPVVAIEPTKRTAPIARTVLAAAVIASVDARNAAVPERMPRSQPEEPPIPTLQLVCAAVAALALFVVGLIMFMRSRGVF
jgi:hypothetical protein